MSDYLKSEIGDVKKKGFGIIPKLVMADERLSIESKAIYSYMASYAGAGDTAFPGVERMIKDLNISINRFYKHRKPLIDLGYITVTKTRKEGRRDNNVYTLNQIVKEIEKPKKQPTQNEGVENEEVEKQPIQNEDIEFEDLEFQCIENEYANNNSSLKSTVLNNNSIKQQQGQEENKDTKDLKDVVVVLENKISIQEARTILKAANGDIELIKAKYEIAKVSRYKGLVGFMVRAIENNYQMPKKQDKPENRNKVNTKFHNFDGRTSKYSKEELNEKIRRQAEARIRGKLSKTLCNQNEF